MIVIITILIILLIGVAVFAAYSLKFLRIEKVSVDSTAKEFEDGLASGGDGEGEPGEGEPELVDLVEYFQNTDNRPGPEEALSQESGADEPVRSMYEEDAVYDRLTNLLSGRAFVSQCNKFLAGAYVRGEGCAVAYFDIDRFRFINSVKGHSLGDYVLTHLAGRCQTIFPEESMITRISADHFAVLFPISSEPSYDAYAEEMRRFSEDIKNDIGVKSSVRFCIGIAEALPNMGQRAYNMDVLLKKANIARHCLKMSRSENFGVFNETMVSTFLFGESATDDFNENQYGDDFIIYFQPMTDVVRGMLWGANALARWTCQEVLGETVSSENGFIPTNNIKVIYQVCRFMNRWRKAGKEQQPVCVNIPETDFFKSNLDEFFLRCASEFQLEPKTIIAVIDAATLRVDQNAAMAQVNKLKEAGIRLAVGGVDAGLGSFDFLDEIPAEFVKCRRNFTKDIQKLPEKGETIRKIIEAAGRNGALTIFEGINSLDQLKAAQSLGAVLMEGYQSGRAVQGDDFARMIDEGGGTVVLSGGTVIASERDFNQGDYML
ncbi:MAG: EAL domain-containing protein [Oscillospiraceae bacterium]|nr:EAL domain-containing protein [Oscillospiraceae bacterium]